MSSFSDYTENKVLELIVGKTAFTLPTAYVALFTAAPSDAGGGTEATGGSYARKSTAGADWSAAAGGAISNSAAITFVTPSGSWGTVTHFALFDASTAGNMLGWAPLSGSQAVGTGNVVSFAIGDLDITFDLVERIVKGRSATLTHTFSAAVTGTPTVTVVRQSDGTTVTTGAVSGSSPTFTYTIPASSNTLLDTYTETWTATQGGTPQTYVDTIEVAGGVYFNISEMRALLPNATTYPDAAIADMRTLVEQAMEQVAEVAFVPRWERETINGDGSHHQVLRWSRVREVKAVTVDDVPVTPLSAVVALREGVAYYQSGWTFGYGNVQVTYEHGYDNPPGRIAQAALQEAKYRLTAANSPTDARTITATYDGGTTILQQPGRGGMHFFLPETDEAVNQYSEQLKVGVS